MTESSDENLEFLSLPQLGAQFGGNLSDYGQFCADELWNLNLTWYTEEPDLTQCFQETVLVYVPCIFLWTFSIIPFYYHSISRRGGIPWTWLNISKLSISVAMALLVLIQLGHNIGLGRTIDLPLVFYVTPTVKILTLIFYIFILQRDKCKGFQSSGVLFIFWLLNLMAGSLILRSQLLNYYDQESETYDDFTFIVSMIYFSMTAVQFILICIQDAHPLSYVGIDDQHLCPDTHATYASKIVFAWFDRMSWLGYRRPLESSDLWSLNEEYKTSTVMEKFYKHWEALVSENKKATPVIDRVTFKPGDSEIVVKKNSKSSSPPSILQTITKSFWPSFLGAAFIKLVSDVLTFVSPQILNLLIRFTGSQEEVWKGYLYVAVMFGSALLQSLLLGQYFHKMFSIGMQLRNAVSSSIYRKALVIAGHAKKKFTTGEIVNLMSVDAQRFMDLTTYINLLWSAPLQIILAMYFLWQILGASVFAGLAVMVILIPINGVITSFMRKMQIVQMKNKDQRVKLMTQILNGIKVLKLYAWEKSFEDQIEYFRNKEIQVLKKLSYLSAIMSFFWTMAPFLVSLVTFTVFVLSSEENVLTPEKAFVAVSLFNILRFPLSMLPGIIAQTVQASVSLKRINKYMNAAEIDPDNVGHNPSSGKDVEISNGEFSWSKSDVSVLRDINLSIPSGYLVAIVGPVASGKSSLLSAILGEMYKQCGSVDTKGKVAYVPQQAWIQNETLKNNILFGRNCYAKEYEKVISACALDPDLALLPSGDETEIGEKGINLSGGQKQRISIARAIYSNSDLYLFDDPLSAVDVHVGKHIFSHALGPKGALKYKTRLLVTHQITLLKEVDLIVVMKDGQISEQGTYTQLLEKKGAFSEFLLSHLSDNEGNIEELETIKKDLESSLGQNEFRKSLTRQISDNSASVSENEHSISVSTEDNQPGVRKRRSRTKSSLDDEIENKRCKEPANKLSNLGKLIESERSETGKVKMAVYLYYVRAIGLCMTLATLFFYVVFQVFSVACNIWLSVWSEKLKNKSIDNSDMYLGVYGAFGLGQAITILFGSWLLYVGLLNASKILHDNLLSNLMKNPMSFFESTPMGRLLNRFSKDVDVLDSTIAMCLRGWLYCLLGAFATLLVISYTTPAFMIVIIPISVIYYFIQHFYVATSRQLKRLESISRSPIYSHFEETVSGCSSIRAFGKNAHFIGESEDRLDKNQICYYPSVVANRWLAIRLEFIGNIVVFLSAMFAVYGRDSLTSGLVGLSISYALQITSTANWLVRTTSEVETNIVAVERMKEYTETENEAPWEVPSKKPPPDWPFKGEVKFEKYETRYREGHDTVLKGISFEIASKEKIGIVGRTGAGKSSLTLALFRILEASSGKIYIDGIDISEIGLHDLRKKLTIIPQDPVLFSGTLRMNLDPFSVFSDEQVWTALEQSHLKPFVKGLEHGLQFDVAEGGSNLSVGQRQLVCLARALLRKTKILVLDEATAAIDLETDALLQITIREEFKDCTIITIAHRMNTIMDYDRVMVLEHGRVKEFASPKELLADQSSVYYGMAKEAGLV